MFVSYSHPTTKVLDVSDLSTATRLIVELEHNNGRQVALELPQYSQKPYCDRGMKVDIAKTDDHLLEVLYGIFYRQHISFWNRLWFQNLHALTRRIPILRRLADSLESEHCYKWSARIERDAVLHAFGVATNSPSGVELGSRLRLTAMINGVGAEINEPFVIRSIRLEH